MRVQITLKSGAQIEADVEEFTVTRSRLEGELVGLKWTGSVGGRALKYVRLDEIAAITYVDDEGPTVAEIEES